MSMCMWAWTWHDVSLISSCVCVCLFLNSLIAVCLLSWKAWMCIRVHKLFLATPVLVSLNVPYLIYLCFLERVEWKDKREALRKNGVRPHSTLPNHPISTPTPLSERGPVSRPHSNISISLLFQNQIILISICFVWFACICIESSYDATITLTRA